MTTGKRISEARKRKGLIQDQLAEQLKVTSQAVSSWERDEYLPETKNLVALAEALDTTVDALLRDDCGWEMKPVNFSAEHMKTRVKTVAQDRRLRQTQAVVDLLEKAHGEQKRKSNHGFDTEYMVHPLTLACHALAMGIRDDDVLAAVLAHDMVEDCRDISLEDLPVNGRVREAVRLVSKNLCDAPAGVNRERYYYGEIEKNPLACLVKCLDRVNNLAGMADYFGRDKMVDYVTETDRYYPALLEVVKKEPEWNDAWWLLRYQMNTLVETFKRLL